VYGIVKQNNGNIYVYSEKGRGTTIKIFWTIAEGDASILSQPETNSAPMLTGSETILLAEDDEQVRAFAADSLRVLGYTLLVAENGSQALQLLAENQQPIDLLVTDVIMPQMDGPTLTKTLHLRFPELPVLFMSGYTDDLLGEEGEITHTVQFLQKPFSAHQLAKKVRAILDGIDAEAKDVA
jgi:CheY-like chemotaxis protein